MIARADILVIGAGIMGVASAYCLTRNNPGKTVLVIDRYVGFDKRDIEREEWVI